jgi:hypothetical protein
MSAELQVIAVSALVLVLGVLGAYLVKLIQAKVKNQFLGNVLARAASAVTIAVKATAQTYSDALKERAADGQLTPEEQKQALAIALEKAKSYISLAELAKAFDLSSPAQAEKLLADQIEASIKDVKASSVAAVGSAAGK